jgi:hypothetical protein
MLSLHATPTVANNVVCQVSTRNVISGNVSSYKLAGLRIEATRYDSSPDLPLIPWRFFGPLFSSAFTHPSMHSGF